MKRFSLRRGGYRGSDQKKRQIVAVHCCLLGNSGVSGAAGQPLLHCQYRQNVVRNPTSTLRPGAGAMSRRIELA